MTRIFGPAVEIARIVYFLLFAAAICYALFFGVQS
jgi:hypothetical protein